MSDKGKPVIFTVNGVSRHIANLGDLSEPSFGDPFPGVTPIEIHGRFDDGTEVCVICGDNFVPGPEGILTVTVEDTGQRFTPVCYACGTSLMSHTEPT